jgi:hypothetical protein
MLPDPTAAYVAQPCLRQANPRTAIPPMKMREASLSTQAYVQETRRGQALGPDEMYYPKMISVEPDRRRPWHVALLGSCAQLCSTRRS